MLDTNYNITNKNIIAIKERVILAQHLIHKRTIIFSSRFGISLSEVNLKDFLLRHHSHCHSHAS
jgi:hypothetical protein